MITLEIATKAAFDAKQITVEPILSVFDESGVEFPIPANLLPVKPARQASPVLSRSPVVRLDLQVVVNDYTRNLFKQRTKIVYKERVNGQIFDRFVGKVYQMPDKGWALSGGSLVETLKIVAFSPSQELTRYDDDRAIYGTSVAPDPNGWEMRWVTRPYSMGLIKASVGDDLLPITQCFDPHTNAVLVVGGVTKVRGTDYNIVVTSNRLAVNWLANAPAAGTGYTLTLYVVDCFVLHTSHPTSTLATTPGTPTVFTLTTDPTSEIELEDVEATTFAYERLFTTQREYQTGSGAATYYPVAVYTRTGTGTGAASENAITNWLWYPGLGKLNYNGSNGVIFSSATAPRGYEIMFVGLKGAAYVNSASAANQAEKHIFDLYNLVGADVGAVVSDNFTATGIALGDHTFADKGDKSLSAILSTLPPNYLLMDDETGKPRGKYVFQGSSPDFSLSTVTSLKDTDEIEFFTRIQVKSERERANEKWKPVIPSDKFTNGNNILDGTSTTYATLSSGSGEITINTRKDDELKSITVRFEGEMRVFSQRAVNGAGFVTHAVPGYERVIATVAKDITIDVSSLSHGQRQSIILWFGDASLPSAVPAKIYEVTVDRETYVYGEAWLSDDPAYVAQTGWYDVTGQSGRKFKQVDTATLKRYMVNYPASQAVYYANPQLHYTKVIELQGLGSKKVLDLATAHMDEVLRKATAQEAGVILEPQAQIGDTVQVVDLSTNTTYLRMIVGYQEGNSWTEPSVTLELANFA